MMCPSCKKECPVDIHVDTPVGWFLLAVLVSTGLAVILHIQGGISLAVVYVAVHSWLCSVESYCSGCGQMVDSERPRIVY